MTTAVCFLGFAFCSKDLISDKLITALHQFTLLSVICVHIKA